MFASHEKHNAGQPPGATDNANARRRTGRDWDRTLIAYTQPSLKNVSVSSAGDLPKPAHTEQQRIRLRLAHDDSRTRQASLLVQRMYTTRDYPIDSAKRDGMRITVMAYLNDQIVGTVTLNLDSDAGLLADQLYLREVDQLRAAGKKIGELTQLAISPRADGLRMYAGLLHIAYIYGRRIHEYTDLVLEVAPRYVNFYIKVLGCKPLGPERLNPRINASVQLLHLTTGYIDAMIDAYGGQGAEAKTRTLYAHFFSRRDEEGILGRLSR